jgi:SAM-dependent methyltransferase
MGCGSGEWVMQVGMAMPKTTVIGIDLSPIQETYDVPDNVNFFVADINDNLDLLDDASTDLVASRQVSSHHLPCSLRVDFSMLASKCSSGQPTSKKSGES